MRRRTPLEDLRDQQACLAGKGECFSLLDHKKERSYRLLLQNPMSLSLPTEFMRANWRTFAEFVAAAILLAIIQRSQATFSRRISNPDGQPTTATHLAYAASAVIQPGQTSMLEYGSHVRSRRPGVEAVPTVMRKFEPIHTLVRQPFNIY